jgi:hypothetical protein
MGVVLGARSAGESGPDNKAGDGVDVDGWFVGKFRTGGVM